MSGTRRNQFTQHRQFRQVSCNWCTKERYYPSNKGELWLKTPIEHVYERKNRWNTGILNTIINRSASNSECGPVCDLKTVEEVSRTGDVTRQLASGQPRVTTLA
ncbi:hypothetical protein TNCV_757771 [Trichonephila clavipes]|nr:hypothetical protein TNCV_757771 [Trichonephila clavipes]